MKKIRQKIMFTVEITVLCGLAALAYAYFVEPFRFVVTRETIKIKNWNPAFENLKIVLISDVHGGSRGVTAEKIKFVVEKTNEQNADIIVLLGDYVSQQSEDRTRLKMPVAEIADNLRGLKAKFGVFAVLGNHDGWHSDSEVRAELSRVGYKVLENEAVTIEKDNQKLRILGIVDHLHIRDSRAFSSKLKAFLTESGESGDIIALEHSPDILPAITGDRLISKDLKLVLAGHTHGGQVWFPVFGSLVVPSNYGQKYAFGHIRENDVDMFVTTGVGTSVLPIRLFVPPEIAVLRLNAE